MDFVTLLSILWRRWFVVLPIVSMTAAVGVVVIRGSEVQFTATGSELLVVRSQTDDQSPNRDVSPAVASSLVVDSLQRDEFETTLREAGLESSFDVALNAVGSLVTITAIGDDPADVLATVETIIERVPDAVESIAGEEVAAAVDALPLTQPTLDRVVEDDDTYTLIVPMTVLTETAQVTNPFPPNGSTISALGEIAARPEIAEAVLIEVPSGSYSVTGESRPVAPIVTITASADLASDVNVVYQIVRDELTRELDKLQAVAGVDRSDQTVMLQLVAPTSIEQSRGSVVRSAAGIALLGLVAACVAAILVDLGMQRRKARREAGN